jgi:uncharacterized membrane protein HdeD (DUF308 family)
LGVLHIVFGFVGVLLSTVVLAYPGLDILTLILILVIALIAIGLARTMVGVFAEYMPDWLRTLNVGGGLFEIVVTIMIILSTQYITQTTQELIRLLSVALLVHGTISALIGRFVETLPRLLRGLCVIIGLLNIALSTWAFVSTPLGLLTSIRTLSIGYLSTGIIEIILSIFVIRRSRNDDLLDTINPMVQEEL